MDTLCERINDSKKWPCIAYAEQLDILNDLADKYFAEETFDGMLASVLIYHQIVEEMCKHIIEDCYFYIELSVYPLSYNCTIPSDKMLGHYIRIIENTIDFEKKNAFIQKVTEYNKSRNQIVHELCKSNIDELTERLRTTKKMFDDIYDLYDYIQDSFRACFHDFAKDLCDYE